MTQSRTRTWLLVGSLALNLFLIGFMVIGAVRHHFGDGHSSPRPFRDMIHFMRDHDSHRHGPKDRFLKHMPPGDAPIFEELRAKHGPILDRAWDDARAAREDLRHLMREGNRDKAALEAALNKAQEAQTRSFDATNALILDIAERVSDEGYRNLAGRERN